MSSEKGKFLLSWTRLVVKDEFKLSGHIIKDVVYNKGGPINVILPPFIFASMVMTNSIKPETEIASSNLRVSSKPQWSEDKVE